MYVKRRRQIRNLSRRIFRNISIQVNRIISANRKINKKLNRQQTNKNLD